MSRLALTLPVNHLLEESQLSSTDSSGRMVAKRTSTGTIEVSGDNHMMRTRQEPVKVVSWMTYCKLRLYSPAMMNNQKYPASGVVVTAPLSRNDDRTVFVVSPRCSIGLASNFFVPVPKTPNGCQRTSSLRVLRLKLQIHIPALSMIMKGKGLLLPIWRRYHGPNRFPLCFDATTSRNERIQRQLHQDRKR
jgi:hypothetical protein